LEIVRFFVMHVGLFWEAVDVLSEHRRAFKTVGLMSNPHQKHNRKLIVVYRSGNLDPVIGKYSVVPWNYSDYQDHALQKLRLTRTREADEAGDV
jgi:hypothetical protein